jgi:hypothetical protein
MMELVIDNAWEFWGLIGGILLAGVVWLLLSRILIRRLMRKCHSSAKHL